MGKYFDFFPKITYTLSGDQYADQQIITNITFRMGIIQDVLSKFGSYYMYTIKDGETPEILAGKLYGDPQGHWVILYANNIMDPQVEWPMNYSTFNKYIADKYGSEANARTTYHHYEKVITRENRTDNVITTTRFNINQTNAASSMATTVPYDTYTSLADSAYSTTNIVGGKSVIETVSRNAVSNYDWEHDLNESRRIIRIIKKEYYAQILDEFDRMTNSARNPNLRTI